jgi:hypothetical protein
MTSESLTEIIESEIAGDWSRPNDHGCDLRRCLVTPKLTEYFGSHRPDEPDRILSLWHVLEEEPETKDGYQVVFSEEIGMFGLAVANGVQGATFIGYYGTFLQAFHGM